MKKITIIVFILFMNLCACQPARSVCPGSAELPPDLAGSFAAVEDAVLLNSALGQPGKGALCQGKVYLANKDAGVTIYRTWNSTNPNSRFGTWWSFDKPSGKTAQFRVDYEVCYQWSPLDTLTRCSLKAGTKIVVGTGQSAQCSEYLTYPAAAAKQVYINNAAAAVSGCADYDLFFHWEAVNAGK